MRYVFGPVPSRRLGQSLGIDPVPLKTCNWNCVYCQLGRTRPITNERKEFFPREEIVVQIKEALESHKPGDIDWITFVGSGETMLYSNVGWLICQIKMLTKIPVAVITNGSLLYLPEVRQELAVADAVLPSLDAGNEELYQKINRPHPQLTYKTLVDGLTAFRSSYQGKLWVEVMLIRGLNDSEENLKELKTVIAGIHPDEVHLVLPTRPPVEPWVQPTDEEGLMRARAILGSAARTFDPMIGDFDLSGEINPVDAIVGIITRHPMKQEELINALTKWSPDNITEILEELEKSGKAQLIKRYGVNFWTASPAYFPNNDQLD